MVARRSEEKPSSDPVSRSPPRRRYLVLIIVGSVALLYFLARTFNIITPADLVRVRFENATDLEWVAIVADTGSRTVVMRQYHYYLDYVATRHLQNPEALEEVQWVQGRRYGILGYTRSGESRLWWLTGDQIILSKTHNPFGKNIATIVVPPATAGEMPDAQFMRTEGFPMRSK